MAKGVAPCQDKIDKRLIISRIVFAINNIPSIDGFTLRKLQELLNTPEGGFGFTTTAQLIADMELILKYVPGTCGYSLLVLAELLEMSLPLAANGNNFAYSHSFAYSNNERNSFA